MNISSELEDLISGNFYNLAASPSGARLVSIRFWFFWFFWLTDNQKGQKLKSGTDRRTDIPENFIFIK